ncbi:unnamed protein product, partial [Mesorhabditis belari]|uniref:Uncharacterized protein n=1 Tax=Mesorhabditis belari TaxID=2138241 RepID=A0AAF3EIS4_9BILA
MLPLLLFLTIPSLLFAFDCGSDPIQNSLSEMVIKIDCPARLDAFNNCCTAHDRCYAAKAGRENCDEIFCDCTTQAGNVNLQCQAHGRNFCGMVRNFGSLAYATGRK